MNLLRGLSVGLATTTALLFIRALYGWYLFIRLGDSFYAAESMGYMVLGLFGLSLVYTVEVYR